jgi:hypothetical protein
MTLTYLTDASPELIDVCQEYFEISIGCRRPSDLEKQEASERWLGCILSEEEYERTDLVKMLKYPIEFDTKSSLWYNGIFNGSDDPKLDILRAELGVFEILSKKTCIIDGPYIPMLRYEMRVNRELFQRSRFHYAILRQHTLFETVFRMKAGLGQVKWRWSVESVYRGENLIEETTYKQLADFNEMRNNLAHNWFYHFADENKSVREVARTGLNIISRLLIDELCETFESYSDKHPSERLYTKLECRETGNISSNATASVKIECENCTSKFNPQNHHKRCPNCDSRHRYWKE